MSSPSSLPYQEPTLGMLASTTGFIVALNVSGHLIDRLCSSGLVAQIIVGALWGTPLAQWLQPRPAVEECVHLLGYLALLALVATAGIEMRVDVISQGKMLALAVLVGTTGILLPIGLSLLLLPLGFGFTLLESFACGAALSSTSLGTILTLLANVSDHKRGDGKRRDDRGESRGGPVDELGRENNGGEQGGLLDTRVATVLVGAALLDDIVALVLSKVVQVLSPSAGPLEAWTIVRPILSSLLLLGVTAALCSRWILGPTVRFLFSRPIMRRRLRSSSQSFRMGDSGPQVSATTTTTSEHPRPARSSAPWISPIGLATTALIGIILLFVTIAHYIGSSPLVGAFCAGASMQRIYEAVIESEQLRLSAHDDTAGPSRGRQPLTTISPSCVTQYWSSVQSRLLLPFFFASIGFAIPLTRLFRGMIVWKGFVYAGIMAVAKAAAGSWLLFFDWVERRSDAKAAAQAQQRGRGAGEQDDEGSRLPDTSSGLPTMPPPLTPLAIEDSAPPVAPSLKSSTWSASLLLGVSLVARGEIGFLILGLAQDSGLVGSPTSSSSSSSQDAYMVAVWALILNTLVGPISAGILVKIRGGSVARQILRGRWGTV